PILAVVQPPDSWLEANKGPTLDPSADAEALREAYQRDPGAFADVFADEGTGIQSANESVSLNGLPTTEAKRTITAWLAERGRGRKDVHCERRDCLFSRQRYWGVPFPVLLDENDRVRPVDESELPVLLPDLDDFKPSGKPEPPLGKAKEWVRYSE